MFYQVMGSYIDLSAVTGVRDYMNHDHYGTYDIIIDLAGVETPFVRKANKYEYGEIQSAQQAFRHLQDDLARRNGAPVAERSPWPYSLANEDFDLSLVRAIEMINRTPGEITYHRSRAMPITESTFRYDVIVAGRAPIRRVLQNTPDMRSTPLHHEQQRLMKSWLGVIERDSPLAGQVSHGLAQANG